MKKYTTIGAPGPLKAALIKASDLLGPVKHKVGLKALSVQTRQRNYLEALVKPLPPDYLEEYQRIILKVSPLPAAKRAFLKERVERFLELAQDYKLLTAAQVQQIKNPKQ